MSQNKMRWIKHRTKFRRRNEFDLSLLRWASTFVASLLLTGGFSGTGNAQTDTLLAANNPKKVEASEDPTLSSELDGLGQLPKSSAASPGETLYVVQERPAVLQDRFGVMAGVGSNLASDIYTDSTENSITMSYHFDDRLFLSVYGSQVYNELTDSGQDAFAEEGIFPDNAFVKGRYDLGLGYNLIYGKARISRDLMFYFDQFVAIGGGMIDQSNGIEDSRAPSLNVEAGVSFWFGRFLAVRAGVKGIRFEERRRRSSSRVNHVVGYGALGYLFGG